MRVQRRKLNGHYKFFVPNSMYECTLLLKRFVRVDMATAAAQKSATARNLRSGMIIGRGRCLRSLPLLVAIT